MRVAICDDDKCAIEYLENKLKQLNIVNLINKFDSIETFKNAIEDGQRFNIVFVDIDWNMDKTGIDFMSELYSVDSMMQVIYVTGYNERFSQHIFLKKVNLCGFLVKPVDDDLLINMVNNAVERIKCADVEKMTIKLNRDVRSIPYREIVHLESKAHHVTVYTLKETITFYGQLEKEKEKLPYYFLRSHKSYLVNMNYIKRIDKNKIYLVTGDVVDISKSRYTEVRERYFEYIGEEI